MSPRRTTREGESRDGHRTAIRLCGRFAWRGVVVNMGLLFVVSLLILPTVIMAVGKLVVVVLVRMPEDAVLNISAIVHMMGDVPVIMSVRNGWMSVFRFSAFAVGMLVFSHGCTSFPGRNHERPTS